MARWLLKTEPGCYTWEQLVKDKKTVWDGITNTTALKHIRTMKNGDLALIYHTGDERAAVGIAQITSSPYPDPKEDDEKLVVFDLKPQRKLEHAVTLSEIKADPSFAGWDLLRISRLSVVPVPDAMWKQIEHLASLKDEPV